MQRVDRMKQTTEDNKIIEEHKAISSAGLTLIIRRKRRIWEGRMEVGGEGSKIQFGPGGPRAKDLLDYFYMGSK